MTPRAATAALLLLLLGCSPSPDRPPPAPPERGDAAVVVSPVAVLQSWDRHRAAAWAAGDVAALRRLYVPRSVAGRRDVAMLRRWRARGLTVAALEVQVLEGSVLAQTPRRLTVQVTERLARGSAAAGGRRWSLPGGAVATRRVTLWLVGGQWRVARVGRVSDSGP
ncbi:hypothetical protein LRP67_15835 [Nocardioides sp. cx-169]|uniref:hypothetical protein n=1 Tax=Nocardioides sp. cx-169 TaxID=2899080 RepID=UPI001E2B5C11|nr:hypothetical protein [Nocardioides sp. cx-169]MCD4535562.1 hypothetical protein [Nocardioides sp. cx-169]